jgi:hypothetical protein
MEEQKLQTVQFLDDLKLSITNGTISNENLMAISNFKIMYSFINQQPNAAEVILENNEEDSSDDEEDEEEEENKALKYASLGWYIYNFLIKDEINEPNN